MSKILVFAETSNGQLKRSSQELLQAAAKTGQTVACVFFGEDGAKAAPTAAHHGAQEIHVYKNATLNKYNPELFTASLGDIIKKSSATTILGSMSSTAKDLFPRAAARLGAGVVSDAVEFDFSSRVAKKPLYSGKCFANAEFVNSPVALVLMRANQWPVAAADAAKSAPLTEHEVPPVDLKSIIKDVVRGASEKLDLTEANVIVSGGRGLKESANFKMLHDLAEVLNASVGASRAVVDAGWVPHDMQVGQTGKTVAPSLYIAVGISGAIQHLAGMSSSKVIVAINNDPNAPIFQKATYGIVGDAFEIVPQLTAEFKKALHN